MTQSIIIFVIILVVQVISAAVAKKKEKEKKESEMNLLLGKQRVSDVPPIAPPKQNLGQFAVKKDRFAAAQDKAERTAAARSSPTTPKAMPRSQQTFTSQVGSVRAVPKIVDIAAAEKRARRTQGSGQSQSVARSPRASRQALLHSTEDGEATSAQLAKTVEAIHRGILRKNPSGVDPITGAPSTTPLPAMNGFGSLLRSRTNLRNAVVLGEILGPPVALR